MSPIRKEWLRSTNMGAYWRVAGMTYVKYANLCADVVRSVLKEPHLTKVRGGVAAWGHSDRQDACIVMQSVQPTFAIHLHPSWSGATAKPGCGHGETGVHLASMVIMR